MKEFNYLNRLYVRILGLFFYMILIDLYNVIKDENCILFGFGYFF